MRKLAIGLVFLLLSCAVSRAHVGNPDVYYEGDAGPYHLSVTVRLPNAIPGAGDVEIRSAAPEVRSVKVALMHLSGPGSRLEPTPEAAVRSQVDPHFFSGSVWFQEFGAMQLHIGVDGLKGKAQLSVPIASFASQSMVMGNGLEVLLGFLFVGLTVSIAPIVGGLVKDATVPLRQAPAVAAKRRSRFVTAVVFVLAAGFLFLNRAWWSAEAAVHSHNLAILQPPKALTRILAGNQLVVRPAGPLMEPAPGTGDREVKMSELIPDHGHLMHLFLIAQPGMQSLWHLHPRATAQGEFLADLPAMPAGNYALFADITDSTGFPWTLTGTVNIKQSPGNPLRGDDSAWKGAELSGAFSDTAEVTLEDGAHIVWERGRGPLQARVPASFRFRVQASDGSPVRDLEPYMGMAAHAEVVSTDMSTFAHIHPAGSVSMAALSLTQPSSIAKDMPMPTPGATLPADFSFAYGFPQPGAYRVFVQIKRSGHVETGMFNARVH